VRERGRHRLSHRAGAAPRVTPRLDLPAWGGQHALEVIQIDGLHQRMHEAGLPGPLPVRFLPVARQRDEPWLTALGGSRILVRVRREGAMVSVSVKDEGIGIPPEMLERVFGPFVQQPQPLDRGAWGWAWRSSAIS
jgi:hypothetical protein